MRTIERLLFLIIGLGLTMDALHIPLAGIVYTAGFAALAAFYLTTASLLLPAPERQDQVLPLSLLGGIALCCSVMALLFKVQQWPYSTLSAAIGVSAGAITVFAAMLLRARRPHLRAYFRNVLLRMVPAVLVAGWLILLTQLG